MKTRVFTAETLDQAAALLRQGKVVAFPTETVYGLGAIATNQAAVLKVFQAKGRPSDNPLIVHVADVSTVQESVETFPPMAQALADAFWPGPLTMILQAKPGRYAPALSAGLATVSFRMPDHPLTLELIRKTGVPLVGPSANRSTKPSPTKVAHVLADMDGVIAGVVEGGTTKVGVESTVVDLTNPAGPTILRPGVITKEALESVIGPLVEQVQTTAGTFEAPKAPGMKYRHYAPSTPVVAVEGSAQFWQAQVAAARKAGQRIAVLATDQYCQAVAEHVQESYMQGTTGDVAAMNHTLFDGLRTLDRDTIDVMFVEAIPDIGAGAAYMNRLTKAASEVVREATLE